MRNIKFIFFLGLFFLVSCTESPIIEEPELITSSDQSRANIIGEWVISETLKIYKIDSLLHEGIQEYSATFNENGRGTFENEHVTKFDWMYQFDPEKILILTDYTTVYPASSLRLGDVLKNETDYHIWAWEYFLPDVIDGGEKLYKYEALLERK